MAKIPPFARKWIRPGGGGALDFHVDGGGGGGWGCPLGVENLSQYTFKKKKIICIPCRNIAPSLVPDRGPVINIVGWEALESNPVINGVDRQ